MVLVEFTHLLGALGMAKEGTCIPPAVEDKNETMNVKIHRGCVYVQTLTVETSKPE